jgi:hypothetical protein
MWVGMHIAGVMVSGRLHGEKLIPAMFHGMKQGRAEQAINKGRPIVAGLLLLVWISFWIGAFSDSGQILFGEVSPLPRGITVPKRSRMTITIR